MCLTMIPLRRLGPVNLADAISRWWTRNSIRRVGLHHHRHLTDGSKGNGRPGYL